MVLGTALLVFVIGMSALLGVQVVGQTTAMRDDFAQARLLARSAIEYGLHLIATDTEWRTTRTSGSWFKNKPVGPGTISLSGVDPVDADLANSEVDPLVLTGTGRVGEAAYSLSVRLEPEQTPLDALRTVMHSAAGFTIGSAGRIDATGGPVSSNGNVKVDGQINGDLEAASVEKPQNVTGTVTAPAPAKALPGLDVIELYIGRATQISYTSTMEKGVLSPASNPWGALNAEGVYYIDTGGGNLNISAVRLVGTLIVRTRGGRLRLSSHILMRSFRDDYPVLIVDGDLEIRFNASSTMSETPLDVNFNPPGTPYNGVSNTTKLDVYNPRIYGLVHVRGEVNFTDEACVDGAVLCSAMRDLDKRIKLNHLPSLLTNPPEGYYVYEMRFVPGAWKRELVP